MKNYSFETIYWGADRSTEVIFEPTNELPPQDLVTACMVLALYDKDKIVLSKPERGWGILGGHREQGETAEECLYVADVKGLHDFTSQLETTERIVTDLGIKRLSSRYRQFYACT